MKATNMTFKECADWILNRRPDIRSTAKYSQAKDALIDVTMSCDAGECISFMKMVMRDSQVHRNGYGFLAAYDLYASIKEEL